MDSADRLWREEDYLAEPSLGTGISKAAAFADSAIKTLNHNSLWPMLSSGHWLYLLSVSPETLHVLGLISIIGELKYFTSQPGDSQTVQYSC